MRRTAPTRKQRILDTVEHLPAGKLLAFGIKQAWAAIFGGLLLFAIVLTHYVDLPGLYRYDWLFLYAIFVQICLVSFRLEKPREVVTILVFHLVGLGMELFKTSHSIASWQYPELSIFHIGGIPLFSGFMYAAVGSYIARAWRVLYLQFTNFPKRVYTVILAMLIYVNFFSHHYLYDFRVWLFLLVVLLFGRTHVSYVVNRVRRSMPLLLGFLLVAGFIWLAENISTFTGIWLYPNQVLEWQPVSLHKLSAWILLIIISFIMVDLLHLWEETE